MPNLLNIKDLNKEDFLNIIRFSKNLKKKIEPILLNKNIGLIFEKNSTRTRLSFQVGINQLNGNYIDINLDNLNLSRFESFEDTFEIMNRYLDAIVYRTTDHDKLILASKYFKKPIINALSDVSHPCQAISDIFTLYEKFDRLNNFNIVWMGDMNNVLFSLVEACSFLENVKIDIFTDVKIFNQTKAVFQKYDFIFSHFEIDEKILGNADCVMTDVFISMNDKNSSKEKLLKRFKVDETIMSKTNEKTVFMHCLPAKIESEVSKSVIKGTKSIVLDQAENRLHAQRGILKWLNI